MNSKLYILFALLSTLYSWVNSKEFCIGFLQNENKISYTYRRLYGTDIQEYTKIPNFDIIIDGFYWRLEVKDENSLKFMDTSRIGKKSDFFSNEFDSAACIRTSEPDWKKGKAVLFSKHSYSVDIGAIDGDDYKGPKGLESYQKKEALTLSHHSYRQQSFAFAASSMCEAGPECFKVVVISNFDQNGNGISKWDATRYFVYSNKTNLRFSPEIHKSRYAGQYQSILDMPVSRNVIGVIPQWLPIQKKNGIIFLFVDEKKIRWCFSPLSKLDAKKCGENADILVDCSDVELPKEESSNIAYIIIACFVIVIVIVIAIVFFLIASHKRAQKEAIFAHTKTGRPSKTSSTASKTPSGAPKIPHKTTAPIKSPGAPKSPTPPKSPGASKPPVAPKSPIPPKSPGATKPSGATQPPGAPKPPTSLKSTTPPPKPKTVKK